jgi:putative ABC transport system substrate-binding protein
VVRAYRIGVLTEGSAKSMETWRTVLAKRGYVEGKNATFSIRAAEGDFDLLPALAQQLVQEKVDIILTLSTPTAVAAKQATTTIPIVTVSADPVGAGLIETFASPGTNVTGIFLPLPDLAAKRVQLLKEIMPELRSVAIVWNPNNQAARPQLEATEIAARSLRIKTYAIEVGSSRNLEPTLQKITGQRPEGLVIVQDPITLGLSEQLAQFCLKNRIPASHAYRRFVDAGGLMSYGFHLSGLWEAGAEYADKILKGARPETLPMQQPRRVEFVINITAANALHLKIPESVLLRADEVVR